METRDKFSKVMLGTCLVLSACASEATEPASAGHAAAAEAPEAVPQSPASTDDQAAQTGSSNALPTDALPKLDAKTPLKDLPKACQGFEVLGLTTSPGGSTLPNKCAPFHGTYNNPYAIRCVDADPTYKTPYEGDEYCILPPPAELGTQVHVGPADYAEPGTFALAPGSEENTFYYVNAQNADEHYYYRTNWRMRPGSHHMIISVSDEDRTDGWAADLAGPDAKNVGAAAFDTSRSSRSFGGAQRVDLDRPQGTLDVPPENVGIGALLNPKQQFSFNLHHINTSDTNVLREAWVNVWYMEEQDVTQKMLPLAASGSPRDVSIPARQRTVLKYKCDVQADSRIITMNGHRHAHTDRFAIWVKKESGEVINAYESFNWEDMPTYQYDSVSMNPTPDVNGKLDGASSGELKVTKGDEVHFMCDINNTLDVPLRFANEAIDGEMCILFGSYVGATSPCSTGAQRLTDSE